MKETNQKKPCVSRCLTAKSDVKKCRCRCHGEHHGKGTIKESGKDFFGTEYPSAQQYKKLITSPLCSCGTNLSKEPILGYDHEAGWTIKETSTPQWLFIHCLKCNNDAAIWKLGVKRSATFADCQGTPQ